MASPLTVTRNNFIARPKNSAIMTPDWLSAYICQIVEQTLEPGYVYDPAVGTGSLLIPFRQHGWALGGSDINESCPIITSRHGYKQTKFEDIEEWAGRVPDVVVCNPPFNSAPGRKLYPEVFLRQIHKLFGNETRVVMIMPMGGRLNQRLKSVRWRYIRDNWEISSILALPLDTFKKSDGSPVLFHSEVLFFNFKGLRPHYFIPEELLS